MREARGFLTLALALVLASGAQAVVVPANWWSNQTNSENVHDPWSSERVRMGDFHTGYIEGIVLLPDWGVWKITFKAHTDETWDHPEEFIAVYIDGAFVHKVFNTPTPPTTRFEFDHLIIGNQFIYRFELYSPAVDVGHHMIMDPGSVELLPVLVPDIVIKPGARLARINPTSKGVIPVAILTTSVADGDPLDFDAWEVDPTTLAFGPDGAGVAHAAGHADDVDGDGDLDMVVHFRTRETGIACGDTEVTLTGATLGGQAIQGMDLIRTVGCALANP